METYKTETAVVRPIPREENSSYTDCMIMPVIKLDFNGAIISSNRPGIVFLGKLRSLSSGSSLSDVLHNFPDILTPHCSTDISVSLEKFVYHFSVVSFDEAGYVGLYGYQIRRSISVTGYGYAK